VYYTIVLENVDHPSSDEESQQHDLEAALKDIKQDATAWKICRLLSSVSPRELWKITNALDLDYSDEVIGTLLEGPLALLIRHHVIRTNSTRRWYHWEKEMPICKRIRLEIRRENAAQKKEANDVITLAKKKQNAARDRQTLNEAEAAKWAIIALLQQPLEQHELDAIMEEIPEALDENEE
jgi:hypothetical protein